MCAKVIDALLSFDTIISKVFKFESTFLFWRPGVTRGTSKNKGFTGYSCIPFTPANTASQSALKEQTKAHKFKAEKFCMKYYRLFYSFFYHMVCDTTCKFSKWKLVFIFTLWIQKATHNECMYAKREFHFFPLFMCLRTVINVYVMYIKHSPYCLSASVCACCHTHLTRIDIDPKTFSD